MKSNWQTKKLRDIGSIFNGNSINEGIKKEKYLGLDDGLPFIATKDVDLESHSIDYNNGVKIPFAETTFKVAHQNSVLICAEGGSAGKKVAFNDRDICFGNKLFAIETKNDVSPKFVYYWYLTPTFFDSFKSQMNGIIGGVSIGNFKDLEIPLPPLPEQQRIVKILDEVFEKTAKAKDNTEKNLKNARELFESYLQGIFINPGSDWEERKLGEAYDVRDGTHDSPKYHKDGYALVTSKNLKRDELDYRKVKYISEKDYNKINDRSKVDKGDILFAMIGTIGNPVVVKVDPDFAIKNVALFKVSREQDSYFLKYFLDSKFIIDKIMKEAKGTTQKFVGLGYLRNFKINLPKLSEQKKIVAKLDALSAETKKLEAIYKQKILDLEELKKSVLKKAFSGGL